MTNQGVFRWLICGTLFAAPLLFVPVFVEQFELPKLCFLAVIGTICLGQAWPRNLKRNPIGIGFLAFLASCALSTVFSTNTRMSLFGNELSPNGFTTALIYVLYFFLVQNLFKDLRKVKILLKWALISGIFASIYGLLQYLGLDYLSWVNTLTPRNVLRPGSTLGHPNFFAGFLVMLCPICTWFARQNWLWWPALCLFLSGIFIAQSRGALVALLVATIVWAFLHFPSRKIGYLFVAFIASLPVFGAVCIQFLSTESFPGIFNFFERIALLVQIGLPRLEYIRAGLRTFWKFPLFGAGTDMFQIAFQHERTSAYWLSEWAGSPHRAHNELINIAATQGLVGLVAIGFLSWAIWIVAKGTLKRAMHSKTLIIALICSIVSFYVQNLGNFTVSSTGLMFVTLCAILSNIFQPSPPQAKTRFDRRWSFLIPIVLSFGTGYFATRRAAASYHAKQAMNYREAAPGPALYEAELAIEFNPYSEDAALLLPSIANIIYEKTKDVRYFELLLRSHLYSLKLNPAQGSYYYLYGLSLARTNLSSNAAKILDTAMQLEPSNPIFLAGSICAAFLTREYIRALSLSEHALKLYPNQAVFLFYAGMAHKVLGHFEQSKLFYHASLRGKHFYAHPPRQEVVFGQDKIALVNAELGQ